MDRPAKFSKVAEHANTHKKKKEAAHRGVE